jgi:hypothetical protein
VIAPEESARPSITSTGIGGVTLTHGMLCACIKLISIKLDVAPESNNAFVSKDVKPN